MYMNIIGIDIDACAANHSLRQTCINVVHKYTMLAASLTKTNNKKNTISAKSHGLFFRSFNVNLIHFFAVLAHNLFAYFLLNFKCFALWLSQTFIWLVG